MGRKGTQQSTFRDTTGRLGTQKSTENTTERIGTQQSTFRDITGRIAHNRVLLGTQWGA